MKSEVISFKITFQVIIHILKKEYQTITFQLAMYLDMCTHRESHTQTTN